MSGQPTATELRAAITRAVEMTYKPVSFETLAEVEDRLIRAREIAQKMMSYEAARP